MSTPVVDSTVKITAQTEGQQQISALTAAAKDLTNQVKKFADQAGYGTNSAARLAREMQAAAAPARLAGYQVQNLAFQFQDLGIQMVQAAQSSNPLKLAFTALLQQGSQISGIMSQAGIGIGGLVKEAARMSARFLPLAIAAADVGAAFVLMSHDINENAKVHVSWKDTALGTYDAIKAALKDRVAAGFKAMGVTSSEIWESMIGYAKKAVNYSIGALVSVPKALALSWAAMPSAAADIFLSITNKAITGINGLVANTVQNLNNFISSANGLLAKVGLALPTISAPQFNQLSNQFAGSFDQLGHVAAGAFKDAVRTDYVGMAADWVSPYAQKRAVERMKKDGEKAGDEVGKAAGQSAADQFSAAMQKAFEENLRKVSGLMSIKFTRDGDIAWKETKEDMSRSKDEEVRPGIEEAKRRHDSFGGGTIRAFEEYGKQIGTIGERAFETWNKALKGTEDALVNFVMTGKLNFKDLANSIISDLVRIAIQEAVMKPLTDWMHGVFGGMFSNGGIFSGGAVVKNALGNAFTGGNVTAFASGGVVSRPTLFPMARGMWLMGEAGPEAVMPLRRMGNGRLGVEAVGGGGNITVNVDASGSQVQGDPGKSAELGKAMAAAVQAELVRQKRPGGLLAA